MHEHTKRGHENDDDDEDHDEERKAAAAKTFFQRKSRADETDMRGKIVQVLFAIIQCF